jgi:hypothetical protein
VIQKIDTNAGRERFMELAAEVYEHDRNWVAPDPEHVMGLIQDGGPFAAQSRVQSFLAERGGNVVARVAAVMDDAFNEYWKDDVGHLFFFEALPGHDDDVRELLFQACDWLTAAGARTARLSYHYGWQLPMTTDAYDVRPTLFHTYNPAYYHGYIKSGGFSTEKGLAEYRVRFTPELAERYRKMLDYAAETGAGLRSWNFDRMEEENAHFGELYRATYDKHWGAPMFTDEQCSGLTVHMKEVLVPEMTVFAEVDERVVGGVYSLPDLNNPESGHALLLSISLLEEARGRGLNLAMAAKSFLGMMDAGYRSTSYTIVLDENRPSRRTGEKLGCRPERNFVIYSRDLSS